MKKVLVACEYSGIVKDAFIKQGYDAVSCDLRKSESNLGKHYQEDILEHLNKHSQEYDLMIAHPPCTYLSNSGVRWLYEKEKRWKKMIDAGLLFRKLYNQDIPHIAIENPIMHKWGRKVIGIGKQDQSFQPYHFGEKEQKRICLWLKNLPKLEYSKDLSKQVKDMDRKDLQKKYWMGSNSSKERSRFFPGVAEAMAKQWGNHISRK